MLIDFNKIVRDYGKPKGIIHIGAHLMEERVSYLNNEIDEIVWLEANPRIFEQIKNKIGTKELAYNFAISDIDDFEYEFNITNNGESSSILELEKHKIHHPHIHVTEVIKVKSKRMDTFLNQNNICIEKYDFVNLDIQGAELLALKGFGSFLNKVNFIYTEINTDYVYKNCALIEEIDSYLKNFNFERRETILTRYEWGDALYIKKL